MASPTCSLLIAPLAHCSQELARGCYGQVLAREPGRPPLTASAALAAQRELLELLGLTAHTAGSGRLTEEQVVAAMEGRAPLHEAWAAFRRRLARGSFPLLRVL